LGHFLDSKLLCFLAGCQSVCLVGDFGRCRRFSSCHSKLFSNVTVNDHITNRQTKVHENKWHPPIDPHNPGTDMRPDPTSLSNSTSEPTKERGRVRTICSQCALFAAKTKGKQAFKRIKSTENVLELTVHIRD